jgi:tRNA pseudouridine38-40 synthase
MPTQRYRMIVAYRGTRYHGWQRQPAGPLWKGEPPPEGQGIPTVQEILCRAIGQVVRHPVYVVGSSRTDARVHAKGQLAHFDTQAIQIPPDRLRQAVNARLPGDIIIRSIEPAPSDFHAIKWTLRKRYQYFIWHAPDRNPFAPDLCWHRWQKLDLDALRQAAALFVGEHDFASFAKTGHGRTSTVRTLLDCSVSYRAPKLVIGVEGTGFLWNMVRIMVGTLVQVGLGHFTPDDVRSMLLARDRRSSGSTAPPHGLWLHWIQAAQAPPPGEAAESDAEPVP